MEDFWKTLKVIGYIVVLSPAIIGLLMIATGNGSTSKSAGNWKEKRIEYEKQRYEQDRLKNQSNRAIPFVPQQYVVPVRQKTAAPTPEDAYDEGFDNGYEQGVEDGRRGRSHGYGYDNSSSYYNHYETRYEEGYESGYEDGFYEGQSRYEEDGDDD